MTYGLLTGTDIAVLENALKLIVQEQPTGARILEIGVCHGGTAKGLKGFFDAAGVPLDYTGMDNQRDKPVEVPFEGARILLGESSEIYDQVSGEFDLVIIDGCHCVNHVMLDFLHYGALVKRGGFVMFHDINPLAQGKLDYQGHGPKDRADFGTATRAALQKLGLPLEESACNDRWACLEVKWDHENWGGTAIFQKMR